MTRAALAIMLEGYAVLQKLFFAPTSSSQASGSNPPRPASAIR
jgi:hypothetical protein